MPQGKTILQQILANPEEDAPRLVYADWLEENGSPVEVARAQLIRVELELARLAEEDPRAGPLLARERALLDEHGAAWRRELPRWARARSVFRRGFASEVWVTASQFARSAGSLWRRCPVEHLCLRDFRDCVAPVVTRPELARVARLELVGEFLGDDAVAVVASSPHLGNLRDLELAVADLGAPGAWALSASPHLARLEALNLNGNFLQAAGVRALLASPYLTRLRALRLNANALGDEAAHLLAGSPRTAGLRRLDLERNHIGDEGALALARSPHGRNLAELRLGGNPLGEAARAALRERFGDKVDV